MNLVFAILLPVYDNCNYVLRPFCSSKYFNNEKVKCIPIGYKSGVLYKKKAIENTNGLLLELHTKQVDMIYYFNFLTLNLFFVTRQKNLIKKYFC